MVKNDSNRDRKSVSSTAPTAPAPSASRHDGNVWAERLLCSIRPVASDSERVRALAREIGLVLQ